VLSLFFGFPLHFEIGYLLDLQLIFEAPQVILYLRLLLLLFELAVQLLLSAATFLLLEDCLPFLLLHCFLQSNNLRIFFLLLRNVSLRGLLTLTIYPSQVIIVSLFRAFRSLHLHLHACLSLCSFLSLLPLSHASPVLLNSGLIQSIQPKLDLSVYPALLTELLLLFSLTLVLLLPLGLFEFLLSPPEVDVLSPSLLLPLHFLLILTLDLVFHLFLAFSLVCQLFLLSG
jgi:hypothetical protein